MPQFTDRREFPRYAVSLRVFIGVNPALEPDTTADLVDISMGGARLICGIALQKDQHIVIEFPPSLAVGASVMVQTRRSARVRWRNLTNGEFGVQFLERSE